MAALEEGTQEPNQESQVEHQRGSGIEDSSLGEGQRQSSGERSHLMDEEPDLARDVNSGPSHTAPLAQAFMATGAAALPAPGGPVEVGPGSLFKPESESLTASAVPLQDQPLPSAPPMSVDAGTPLGIGTASHSQPLLYHERQEMLLCGMHALNALLQGPFFDEVQLATLAQGLDRREREVMAEAGMETAEYLKFLAEDSANVANDGNFSIQVLTAALELYGLACMNLESREARGAKEQPHLEQAFICHLKAHWFAVRRVGGQWFDFNSLHAAPQALSDFYLSAFLLTLQEEGWTVLVVRGVFPDPGMLAADASLFHNSGPRPQGRWYTPESAKEALKEAEGEAKRAEAAAAALQFDSLPGDNLWGSGGSTGGVPQERSSSGWAPTVISQARKLVQGPTAWAAPGTGRVLGSGAEAGSASDRTGGSSFAASATASDDADLDRAIADSLQMHFDMEAQRRLAQQAAGAGPKEPLQEASQQLSPPQHAATQSQHQSAATEDRWKHTPSSQQPSAQEQGTVDVGAQKRSAGDSLEAQRPQPRLSASESVGDGSATRMANGPSDTHSRAVQGIEAAAQMGDGATLPLGSTNQQAPSGPSSQPGPSQGGAPPTVPGESLPQEGEVASVATVELAIHLPSGERLQRTFRHEDCVQAVVQFVSSHLDKNVRFILAERGFGGKALVNMDMTLSAAGVENRTMLVVKCQSPYP